MNKKTVYYSQTLQHSQQGITTGDSKRYGSCFWEYKVIENEKIVFWQTTTIRNKSFLVAVELILKYNTGVHKIINELKRNLR